MLPSLRDEYSVHHPDRRKSARYECSATIEIDGCSKKYWGRVRNISRHGMFIELPDPPVLNAEFSASLALNKPVRIECMVHRTIPGHGIGVTVTASSKESRLRYESLLRALAVDLESDLSEGNFEKKTASTG
jgi:PilZ domain